MIRFLIGSAGQYRQIAQDLLDIIEPFVIPVLSTIGVAGLVYAIVLGVRLAKSDDEQKWGKAKGDLFQALFGFVLIFVLVAMLFVSLPLLADIFREWYK